MLRPFTLGLKHTDRIGTMSRNSSASEAELKFEEKTEKPFEV